ncbi:MAG: WG repeat-containing protein [Thalassovita sp.]
MLTRKYFNLLYGVFAGVAAFANADLTVAQTGYRWVVEPQYEDAGSAFDGVVPIRSDNKWGLMGADGTWRVPPRFDALGRAQDGHIAVMISGNWGIIDIDGNEIIPPIYQEIGQWADRIPAKLNNVWIVLDRNGREVDGPLPIDNLRGNEGHCIAGQNGDRAFVYDGRPSVARSFDEPFVTSQEAMRVFGPTAGMVRYSTDDGFGFITCRWLRKVDEHLFETARRVIPSNELAAARLNGKWGLFSVRDNQVSEVFSPQYAGMRDYTENRLPVKLETGKWGYLNPYEAIEIKAQFDQAYSFSDGIAGVQVEDKRGFILPDGSYAAEPIFEDFWRHAKGIAPVKLNGKWGVIAFNATSESETLDFDPNRLNIAADQLRGRVQIAVPHKYFRQDYFNVQTIVLSDDAQVMATILDETEGEEPSWRGEIALWDTRTQMALGRLHTPGAVQARFIGQGDIVAVGEVTGHLSLWSTSGRHQLLRLRPSLRPLIHLAASADAKILAASDGESTWLWNLENGEQVGHVGLRARALGAAKDGKSILALDDRAALYRWSGENARPERLAGALFENAITETGYGDVPMIHEATIAAGPVGAVVTNSTGSGTLREIYAFQNGKWQGAALPDSYYSVFDLAISPDQSRVLVGEASSFSLYDLSDLSEVTHYGLHSSEIEGGIALSFGQLSSVDTLTFLDQSDHMVAIGSEGFPIATFDLNGKAQPVLFGAEMGLPVFGASATLAGHKVFHLTGEGHIAVFDLATGKPAPPIPTSDMPTVEYEPHGYLFSGTDGMAYYEFYDGPGLRIDPATMQTTALPPGEAAKFASHELSQTVVSTLEKAGLSETLHAVESRPANVVMIPSASGLLSFLDTRSGERLAELAFFKGDDWAIATELGFFDGTLRGMKALSAVDGVTALPAIEAVPRFHRPDMVQAILAGDPEGIAVRESVRLLANEPVLSAPTSEPVTPEKPAPIIVSEGSESAKPALALPGLDLNTEIETETAAPEDPTVSKLKAPSLPGLSISTEGTD